jgi:hypothetical protein
MKVKIRSKTDICLILNETKYIQDSYDNGTPELKLDK